MKIDRRRALMAALFGSSALGLRALATGLPVRLLMNPRKALADMACNASSSAQFVILSTSAAGDPIGCNAPGTYLDSQISHPQDPSMAPTAMLIGGQSYQAAAPWATLGSAGANVLDRTCFCHIMTDTPVHPKEPQVLQLMGATNAQEMFPSVLAEQLAPCLGTLQPQPLSIGSLNPAEAITYQGQVLPTLPPAALGQILTSPAGEQANLQSLRDQTLQQLYGTVYRGMASPAQRQFLDSMITSQSQARHVNPQYLTALAGLTDNSEASQIVAAVALIQMRVAPVIVVHFAFGGDNHHDTGLATETAQNQSGIASVVSLMQALATAGLSNQVTFATLNVFGRTMASQWKNGRNHNQNHQMSLVIGSGFKGRVIGGVAQLQGDYGCTAINAATGASSTSSNDIQPIDTLASWAKTVMVGVGIEPTTASSLVNGGTVITGALAS